MKEEKINSKDIEKIFRREGSCKYIVGIVPSLAF